MTDAEPLDDDQPAWRQRAVSRSLHAARSRAEARAQGFIDAAFAIVDEKGTTDFTIQEVIDRSGQSLRGFYQYFDGKDELLLALFEETIREAFDDLRAVVDAQTTPIERLHAFVIRLHEWCDTDDPRRGAHNRRPISEFSIQLGGNHPDRVKAAFAPITEVLVELVTEAADSGAVEVDDARRASALVVRTVASSWFGNRLAASASMRISAEDTWHFCLHGLRATT